MPTGTLPIYSSARPENWQPDPLPVLPAGRGEDIILDCESDGVEWMKGSRAVGWAWHYGDRSGYAPMRHAGGGNLPEGQVLRWVEDVVKNRRVVNAWTKFDAHMALVDGVQFNAAHDVMHTEALLDDWLRDFSLDGLAARYGVAGKLDPAPKHMIGELPAWDIAPYAVRDVDIVAAVHEKQRPLVAAQDLGRVEALEDRVLVATTAMEHRGCPIDEALLDMWLEETEERLEREAFKLSRDLGWAFSDTPTCMARLFKQCGITNPNRTAKSGALSFKAEYVDSLAHPTIRRASGLGKLADLRSKFLVPYRSMLHMGRLWPTFHQLMVGEEGTISGRFSCVRPNVQQVLNAGKFARFKERYGLDYNIRKLFVPAAGRWFSADQSQVEYRIASHFAYAARQHLSESARAGAERVVAMYRDNPNIDFHDMVGDMVRPFRPGLNRTEIEITNFRKLYGGGVKSTAVALGISEDDAGVLIGQYDAAFPATKEILRYAKGLAESRGYIRTLSGRRCRFPTMERTYKALNGAVQGSAADDFKLALVTVHEHPELGFTPRMVVHDELGGDLEGDEDSLAQLLNEQRSETHVPILWDTGTGANWAEAKG